MGSCSNPLPPAAWAPKNSGQSQNSPGKQFQIYLGLDFGSYASKAALSSRRAKEDRVAVHRVTVALTDQANSFAPYEFPSQAALDGNGGLILGDAALDYDTTIPLKTLFMYMAGIRRRPAFQQLTGSKVLLAAIRAKKLTKTGAYSALRAHFLMIKNAAHAQARYLGGNVTGLVYTFPNHLCEHEHIGDFVKFHKYYDLFLDDVFSEIKPGDRHSISEGQAAALSATEAFDDPQCTIIRTAHRKVFDDLNVADGLNMLVADWGGSSLNLQTLNLYFHEDGHLIKSQQSVGHGWQDGTRGGSHSANTQTQELIRKHFLGEDLPPGEVAAMLRDFEEQKHRLDWESKIEKDEAVTLHGQGSRTMGIPAASLLSVFHLAFEDGLQALETQIKHLQSLGKQFTILFMGGSLRIPGLRKKVTALVARLEAQHNDRPAAWPHIRYTFLHDTEYYPSTAVSVGAALSMMNVPHPIDMLKDEAIGMQRVVHTDGNELSEGDQRGQFLMSSRCGAAQQVVTNMSAFPRKHRLECSLVSQPNFILPADGRPPGSFDIGSSEEVLNGPPSTYDLNWAISKREVPPGYVRFSVRGSYIKRLTAGDTDPANYPSNGIPFVFNAVPANGKYHKKARKWSLLLKTDPGSKQLTIDTLHVLPFYCPTCRKQIMEARVCKACNTTVCWECYLKRQLPAEHSEHHHVLSVIIDEEDL